MSGRFLLGPQRYERIPSMSLPAYAGSPRLVTAAERAHKQSLLSLVSLRGLPADALLIILYIAFGRAFIGDEAKLGIKIGPLPLFISDATLLLLIAINLQKRGGRLLHWLFSSEGAGQIGRAVWVLFLMALLYFALSFQRYTLFAMRDLAIFGYSLFFPLTCFALTRRAMAVKLVRYFTYATCLGAALFEFQSLFGVKLFNLYEIDLGLAGHGLVSRLSAGNLGADLGPALAALFGYLVTEREHQLFHTGAMLLCFAALAQILDRSTLLGFAVAVAVMFILGVGRSRIYACVLGAGLLFFLLLSAHSELPIPGGARLHNVWIGLTSGANFESDPDAQFRLRRWESTLSVWMTNPLFGVGFGAPIMLDSWGTATGAKGAVARGGLGAFNVGMPHNSFLTVLARMGLIGLGLICFAWSSSIMSIIKLARRQMFEPDCIAIAGALITMIFTAALNLFFERPMLCAPFWIMLATSYKLSEIVPQRSARNFRRTSWPVPVNLSAQQSKYPGESVQQGDFAGGWQARWEGKQV